MAELMLGQPLFPGESGIDQLVEIIKVLGTPTREQIKTMNPNVSASKPPSSVTCDRSLHSKRRKEGAPEGFKRGSGRCKTDVLQYMEHKFPQIKPHPFTKVFRPRTPAEAISLISNLLEYTPTARLT